MNKYKILIFCYILIGLVPYLGAADKIHTQTLYLSVLNIIGLGVLLYSYGFKKLSQNLYKTIQKKQSIFYFTFIIISLLSLSQAYNLVQALIACEALLGILLFYF